MSETKVVCMNSACGHVVHKGPFHALPEKCPECGGDKYLIDTSSTAREAVMASKAALILQVEKETLERMRKEGRLMEYLLAGEDKQRMMECAQGAVIQPRAGCPAGMGR